jgi:hypothetical protein
LCLDYHQTSIFRITLITNTFILIITIITILIITIITILITIIIRLINENVNMSSPDDIAYVTAGFAPILVRLVQAMGGADWSSGAFGETLKLLPGPLLEFNQLVGAPFEELNDVLAR